MFKLLPIEENAHPELAALIARIKEYLGRYGYPYSLLLHSPPIAAAWMELLSAVRSKIGIDGTLRELVIIRVAILTHGDHERKIHSSVHGPKAGLTAEQIAGIENWRDATVYSEAQRATLAYTDAMTQDIHVPDAVKAEMQRHYNERELIELTVLIGTYNMHARVYHALDMDQRVAAGDSHSHDIDRR